VPAVLYPQDDAWYAFLLEAESTPRAIVRLEGLGQFNDPVTPLGIEPATFRLVTQRLNQLRHRVPPVYSTMRKESCGSVSTFSTGVRVA
jgi:hypothetical protein